MSRVSLFDGVSARHASDSSSGSQRARRFVGLGWCFGLVVVVLWGVRFLFPPAVPEPGEQARVDGVARLVSDPEWVAGALSVDVVLDGDRFAVWARGRSAAGLADRLMGERVRVAGRVRPRAADDDWLARRGVVGTLSLDREVAFVDGGAPVFRWANGLRRVLERGTDGWSQSHRSLYLGLVLGDDRGQSPEQTDAFRATGLTHLIAVSGQNVAFVLLLARPLLRRLSRGPRFATTLGLIGFFALLTRFEPSVLRASVMVGLAAWVAFLGRPTDRLRLVSVAVFGLLLFDGRLARSLGFALSVAATVGILLWSKPIAEWLSARGRCPGWLAEPLAVTVAAQAATAPLLIWAFDDVPLIALPANLLAGPIAGAVMMWGLSGGLMAGLFAGMSGAPASALAAVLTTPTRWMLRWLEAVAGLGARFPHAVIGVREALLVAVVGLAYRSRRHLVKAPPVPGHRSIRFGRSLALSGVLGVAVVGLGPPSFLDRCTVALCEVSVERGGVGLTRSASGTVVLKLSEGATPSAVLDLVRRYRLSKVDLAVVGGGRQRGAAVATVQRRFGVVSVLAEPSLDVANRIDAVPGLTLEVGDLIVEVTSIDPDLEVSIAASPR